MSLVVWENRLSISVSAVIPEDDEDDLSYLAVAEVEVVLVPFLSLGSAPDVKRALITSTEARLTLEGN